MKNLLTFIFLTVSVSSFGQEKQNKDDSSNKVCIKIAPLALIDIYSGSSYRIGTEFKLYKNFSLALEGGGYLKNYNGMKDIKGYTFKTELKKYLKSKYENVGNYISLEYFYKRQSYNFSDSILIAPYYYKAYNVNKYITCLTIKYGVMAVSKSNFILDVFVGVGIRFKNVGCTLTEEEMKHRKDYNDSQSQPFMNGCDKVIYPNFDAGVKVGYRIK